MHRQGFFDQNKAIHSIIALGFVFSSFGAGSVSNAHMDGDAFAVPSDLPARAETLSSATTGSAQTVLQYSFCNPDGTDIGAYVAADPPSIPALQSFESLSGRHVCSVTWYQGWGASNQPAFPISNLNELLYHDGYDTYVVPQLTWEPWVRLSDIASGKYDIYLTAYATQVKLWGRTLRLRFAHEMIQDDNYCWGKAGCQEWYPWQDQPAAYIAAFRHVHDVFKAAGAANVEYVWCPNSYPFQMSVVQKYYPGSDYVDWLCMDGYNSGNKDGKPGWPDWQWFDDLFYNLYHTLVDNQAFFGDKPILIGEIASCEASPYELAGQTKSAWITNTFQRLDSPDYARVKSFDWFNINKECDWRINSSPQSLSAFQTAISAPDHFGSHPYLLISGNTGVNGVTLSYTDAVAKTAISQVDGSYSFAVSYNWSGSVTPSHPCFNFSPGSRNYSNVTANQTNYNFTPAFNNNPACAVTTGVFRPANGLLYLKNSNTTGFADISINYGMGGDYPVVGDWDGDGDTTIGIYRNGSFYLRDSNSIGFADMVFPFGIPGDQPLAGDWDGDGIDTIGVYRPSTGQFLLRNGNSEGAPEMSFYLGNVGDVGIAGDWDGDGLDTTGVFRPINGIIFLKNANTTGFADVALNYGIPGDQPVIGDWNNDGIDTIGVYRNGIFLLRNSNTVGFADITFGLGIPGDMPIAGNWDALP